MKKLLLFIAFAIFGLGLNAQSVDDETTIDYDGYSLAFRVTSVEPAECEVSDCTGEPIGVTIPSTVTISGTEFNVTSIGESAFYYCSSLTSIEIPNSVTFIGDYAFSGCSSLTSIEIPNSVTSIGEEAFSYCSSLTSIEIPNSVTSIGDGTFSGCSSITSIIVVEGNPVYDSRGNCNAIIETTSNTLIVGCQNTVIPNSVTSIGESAFCYCSSLTSIEIPNSVTFIGDNAFYDCDNLTSIEIPNSVTSIGDDAFCYCSSLTSIEIPNSVTFIGKEAFSGCSSLTSVIVAEGNTVYDSRENCNAIIETSSNELIAGCQNTVIPNSVTSIGDYAFSRCSSLTSIEIPNSITFIGNSVFRSCSSLTSITFGENSQLTSIGDDAFWDCSSLTSIEIPNSVTSIGNSAFWVCSSLRVIKCHAENVPETESDVFYGCSYGIIICVPENSVEDYKAEHPWNNYYITAMSEISVIEYDGYSLIYIITDEENTECMVACAQDPTMPTSITIPSSVEIKGIEFAVTSIGSGAFSYCSSLTSIEIPNSVTSIGDNAFDKCSSLTSIEIPNSVTSIGNWAFSECSSLKVIKCYAEDVPETGDYVFNYCPSDMIIYVPEVSLEDYKSASPWNAFTILPLNDEENDPLDAPENLVANVLSTSSIILTWDNVENALSYNVYRNGDSIANVTNPTYTDVDLEYNTEYCYTVTAVRNETESDKSEEKCAKTLGESINELSSSINIYPNPVENDLFIATEMNVKEVAIYDVYGRQTMCLQVNETTSQQVVKVADLEAGVYFVNVKTENGNIVKRFVKK